MVRNAQLLALLVRPQERMLDLEVLLTRVVDSVMVLDSETLNR